MDKRLISAAAMAALLAGVSACGNNDYGKNDAEQTAPDATSDTQAAGAPNSDENYGATSEAEPATAGQAMQSTSPANTGGVVTPSDLAIVNVQQLTTKNDIDAVADRAFTAADTNSDGKLGRSEYMTLAESALNYQPTANGAGMSGATGGSAMSAMPSFGASETEIGAAFAEAAGSDNMISEDELQKAFATTFDRADSDNNGQLDDQERETFAQLLAGGNTPAQ